MRDILDRVNKEASFGSCYLSKDLKDVRKKDVGFNHLDTEHLRHKDQPVQRP